MQSYEPIKMINPFPPARIFLVKLQNASILNLVLLKILNLVLEVFMLTMPAQEIKRCGISVLDDLLQKEPVHIIKNNRPQYVVLREQDFTLLIRDLEEARLAASEADLATGRFKQGSSADLFSELEND
jgi:PHD/YefM family antitoxin component YafN of YafNO toxin-antitoxin module